MSAASKGSRALLALGAALGVAVAFRGVVRPSRAEQALPADAVAVVGDTQITRAEYARALAAVESDRRDHRADAELRRHVLDRLVDEELLVQAALELGLPLRDPRLRGQLASAMLDAVVGEPTAPPSDAALRALHTANAETFARRGRALVDALFFRGDGAVARASGARARLLSGEPWSVVGTSADPIAVPVPRAMLAAPKLAEYVGPKAAAAVETLVIATVSEPLAVDGGAWLVRVAARQGGELAPFDEVRSEVLAEWRREEDDRRLRSWLDARRSTTRVAIREEPR